MSKRLRVAIHSLTGCAGCQLTIYFLAEKFLELSELVDIAAAPMIKEHNSSGPYDVCFVEGLVAHERDIRHLKEWRKASKLLVAFGTCATHANVPAMRLFMDEESVVKAVYDDSPPQGELRMVEPSPLERFVKVDYSLSGCPPSENEFLRFMRDLLVKRLPVVYNEPVCVECTLREINCLLEQGKECLGPLTRGGCNALCPALAHGCTGCHGPVEYANFKEVMRLLARHGRDVTLIKNRLKKYAGPKIKELGVDL